MEEETIAVVPATPGNGNPNGRLEGNGLGNGGGNGHGTLPRPEARPGARPAAAGPGACDPDAAAGAVRRLLSALGEDPDRAGLRDTPHRVAKALLEMTQGDREDPARILGRTFPETFDGLVVVRGVTFASLCEHHLLPFRGTATIAYLPAGKVVGLSKLSRLVQAYARRLQVQERMTRQLAEAVGTHLQPRGVAVVLEAEHTCMSMRGVRAPGTTVTTAFLGDFRTSAQARQEVLAHGAGHAALVAGQRMDHHGA